MNMLRCLVAILLLPANAFAGTTERVLQYILADYQAQCSSLQQALEDESQGSNEPTLSALRLSDKSIYELTLTTSGTTATVLYANPVCPSVGSAWCGTSGCTSYVIVDGVSFQAQGFRPISASIGDSGVAVIVPRSGGACTDAEGYTLSNDATCYAVAVWDDVAKTFNSIGSGDPVFTMSEFMP